MAKYTAFKNIFIIYAHHFFFIPTHIVNLLFFSKKLSIKDMVDFPVPTQDVTGIQTRYEKSFFLWEHFLCILKSTSLGMAGF